MQRASRYVIVSAVLFGLLSFAPMRSAFLSVDAAPGLSLLRGRSIGSSTWLPPALTRMPMLDRLLRRPSSAGMGNAITPPGSGLRFDGVDDRVTFGPALPLGAQKFTLEVWFMREGAGVATSTGTGGVTAVPLVTKGRAEAEGSNVDMNYFLGIDGTTQVLVADFEDMAGGVNHPVVGTTRLWPGVWYHAAVTYDGGTWRLYLNGTLDIPAPLVVAGAPTPRFDSIQHAGLGTAFTSTGVAAGFFKGQMDEARIWNVARTRPTSRRRWASP